MSRDAVRQMKKALRAGSGSKALDAALALLERSVRMRHRRLAVQRLNEALALGVSVPEEHWRYCREAAAASHDTTVQALFVVCAQAAPVPSKGSRHG